MWQLVADELGVPWSAAERVYMQLGRTEMDRRARIPAKKTREVRAKSPEMANTHLPQVLHRQPLGSHILRSAPTEHHQQGKVTQGGFSYAKPNVESLPSIHELDLGISVRRTYGANWASSTKTSYWSKLE